MSLAQPVHISDSLTKLLVESLTTEQLRHIVAQMAAREHVPNPVAVQLAEELAAIYSSEPLETEHGTVHNAPTLGWHRRRTQRIAEARL
jgi:hypothetical protein